MARRSSQTFTVSLPPDFAAEVDRVAGEENRSRSELVREAFRQYIDRQKRWERIFRFGEEAARKADVKSDEDVARIVKERRKAH